MCHGMVEVELFGLTKLNFSFLVKCLALITLRCIELQIWEKTSRLSELGEYVFQSVFLALLLEISLIGGIVHQLRHLTSCWQIQPTNNAIYHLVPQQDKTSKSSPIKSYPLVWMHSLVKPSFIFSVLVDKSWPILHNNILLSHSPWHWTVHLNDYET